MTRTAIILMVTIVLSVPFALYAQDSLSLRLLDEIANLSADPTIQLTGNLMIVQGKSGLILSDLTNPARPITRNVLTRFDPENSFTSPYAISGEILVIAEGQHLNMFRLQGVDNPRSLGQFRFEEGNVRSVAIEGDQICAYVLNLGLVTVDASDPANLQVSGCLEVALGYPGLILANQIAYAWSNVSVILISIANMAEPTIIAEIREDAKNFTLEDNMAYLLTSDSLIVYDVSTPNAPSRVAGMRNGGGQYDRAQAVSVVRGQVAICYTLGKVKLFELNGQFELVQSGEYRTASHFPQDCRIWGDYIVSAGGNASGVITIIDAHNPTSLREASEIGLMENPVSMIAVSGQLLFPSDTTLTNYEVDRGGKIIRVARKLKLLDGGWLPIEGGSVVRDAIYHADLGIDVYDAFDPTDIRLVNRVPWQRDLEIRKFGADERYALAVTNYRDLNVLTTDDYLDPQYVGQVHFRGNIAGIGLGDDVAFVAVRMNRLEIQSIDLRYDHWLQVCDSLNFGISDAAFDGFHHHNEILYTVVDSRCGLFDVSDPAEISILSEIDSVYSIQTYEDRMIYSHLAGGIRIIDVTDPSQPFEISRFDDARQFSKISLVGNLLYAIYPEGVVAFEVEGIPSAAEPDDAFVPKLLSFQAYPNPFNGSVSFRYSLPANLPASLTIADILGRSIAKLELSRSAGIIVWKPEGMSSGTYFSKMDAGSESIYAPIVFEK